MEESIQLITNVFGMILNALHRYQMYWHVIKGFVKE